MANTQTDLTHPTPKQEKGQSPTAIFLHIPKTAGTTLLSILDRQYPPGAIHSFGGDAHASVAQFKALDEQSRAQIRLLRGHMVYGLHEYLPQPVIYFTVLRDPVTRVISYFNYILRTPPPIIYMKR